MKVCDKTCIFCFFPVINKYLCMAKCSLLSSCPSYRTGIRFMCSMFVLKSVPRYHKIFLKNINPSLRSAYNFLLCFCCLFDDTYPFQIFRNCQFYGKIEVILFRMSCLLLCNISTVYMYNFRE